MRPMASTRGDGRQRAGELDGELQGDFRPRRVHVVLDHDLQAELGVPEQRQHEGEQQRGVQRLRDGGADRRLVGAEQANRRTR